MRILLTLSLLGWVVAPALAGDAPSAPQVAAGQVLSAIEAGNEETLRALAQRDGPDPWLVADELLHQGRSVASRLGRARGSPAPPEGRRSRACAPRGRLVESRG